MYVIRIDHPTFDADHKRRMAADGRSDLRWDDRVALDAESLRVLESLGLGGVQELALGLEYSEETTRGDIEVVVGDYRWLQ